MKALSILLSSLFLMSSAQAIECPAVWHCEMIPYKNVQIRAGYLEESNEISFKGNVIYFEGLGDSMLNHYPLFQKLTKAGFRVLAFDYQGQGGSEGSMDDTRITEIPDMGNLVWNTPGFARDLNHYGAKNIIGWSTGGLAAYYASYKGDASKVVLIAPGIFANSIVGEQNPKKFKFDQITLPTLTTAAPYGPNEVNPHLEPIKPTSPLQVKFFATDLLAWSIASHFWIIDSSIKGFVLLSGKKDTYVNADRTKHLVDSTDSSFTSKVYDGALHEIDNEKPVIAEQARTDILNFLLR